MAHIIYFLFLISINIIHTAADIKSDSDYYQYLQQFGYTPKVEDQRLFSVVSRSLCAEDIKRFQRLYKLPATGELNINTKTLMGRGRCGNSDWSTPQSIRGSVNVDKLECSPPDQGRSKNVKKPASDVTHRIFWPKKHLTWFIEKYPKQQKQLTSQEQIRRIMNEAFHDWEKYSGLKFQMVTTKQAADLKIKFHTKDHGDGYPFDGQGSILAHAFRPTSGDIHFDDDESFTDDYTNQSERYTLRLVAAQAIGHALGLSQSFETNSLMYPVYQQFSADYNISDDDRQSIQTLYGKPDSITTNASRKTTTLSSLTSTHSSNVLPVDNWCSGDFQTGCEGPDGNLYLFKESQVWRYQTKRKRSWDPQPKLIRESFPALNDTTITACVRSTTGYTYLFRNYRLWKVRTRWSVDGPHMINGKHYPQNPRAALLHQNSIYLIRNRLIYRLNEFDLDRELEILNIGSILNPPPDESIRSGFTYDKRHYIFTRKHVYVYDSKRGQLLQGYPKPITNGWFACEGASQPSNSRKKTTTTAYGENDQHDDDHHHPHRKHHHPERPPHRHRHN